MIPGKSGQNEETMQECFTKMADDFFVLTILAKVTPENMNLTLPWIFSHVIELSIKSCCLEFNLPSTGHNLSKLWNQVAHKFSDQSIWPEKLHFEMYKKVFLRGDTPDKTIDGLPTPENLYKAELAYWIENVRDLKYGFDLKATMVSMVHMSYPGMNPAFLRLFKNLRDKYKNQSLDERYINKVKSLFPEPKFQAETIGFLV